MASSNRFDIIVNGVGGHAAHPHKTVDPIMIAAEMVQSLQSLITRNKNPIDTAVLWVTHFHAGDAYNVIPAQAVIRGTLRTYSVEVLDLMEHNMRRLVTKLCEAHGASGELNFVRCYPPLSNWPKETAFAADLAEDSSAPIMSIVRRRNTRVPRTFPSTWKKCPGPICSSAMARAIIARTCIGAWGRANCTIPTTTSTMPCCPSAPRSGPSWWRLR